jgi:putative thioredoxin
MRLGQRTSAPKRAYSPTVRIGGVPWVLLSPKHKITDIPSSGFCHSLCWCAVAVKRRHSVCPLQIRAQAAHKGAKTYPMRTDMFGTPDTQATAGLIKDGNEQTFLQDVIEPSKTVPVIVDFWAPWCGPCKTLGPALEAAVTAAKGAVRMVKINVDENQMLSQQLRIQSIPTVYAFFNGQPVDGFQGAIPGSEIKKFIEGLAKLAGGSADDGLADALAAAEEMLTEGAAADAAETFAAILEEDPANAAAYGGLIRAHLAMGDLDQAETLAADAPAEVTKSKEVEAARAQIELARQAAKAGPVDELRALLAKDPADRQVMFDLATALHASGDVEGAVNTLLDLFKLDREWNDGAARAQLFIIFEALKPQDPIVLAGRRRLSSMIFA